jgi:hypothetical protein
MKNLIVIIGILLLGGVGYLAYTHKPTTNVVSDKRVPVPTSLTDGTNLATDSYVSIESKTDIPVCRAEPFLTMPATAIDMTDAGVAYSVASTTDAGAGNRYEEWVYALKGSHPCRAVRYFIHYGVFENYPPGAVKAFDRAGLLVQFDAIRRTLIVNR